MIHQTATIDPKAKISSKVQIGPYCVIGPDVEIDYDVILQSHVHIIGKTRIGKKNCNCCNKKNVVFHLKIKINF